MDTQGTPAGPRRTWPRGGTDRGTDSASVHIARRWWRPRWQRVRGAVGLFPQETGRDDGSGREWRSAQLPGSGDGAARQYLPSSAGAAVASAHMVVGAKRVAERAVQVLEGAGVFGVELFRWRTVGERGG